MRERVPGLARGQKRGGGDGDVCSGVYGTKQGLWIDGSYWGELAKGECF